ncbi:MAG: LacI family DNA-binding transcriptional regulator, partial [Pseudomonadota bacterium]
VVSIPLPVELVKSNIGQTLGLPGSDRLRKQKWVTMQDVARRARVGKITVSRVIRTPEKVATTTRERVQAAIQDLGYVPDETAGALSSSRSRVIGALVSTLSDSVFASTIDGLSRTLRRSGYELLLTNTDYDPEIEEEALRTLLGRRPDGLVLTSTSHTEAMHRLIRASNVPVVEIWQMPRDPIDYVVGFSNYNAGLRITQYLIEKSYRKIAFIGGDRQHDIRGQRRAEGYADALRQAGLGQPLLTLGSPVDMPDVAFGAASLNRALESWPDLDAVVCVSDPVAMGVICEANRRQLAIPDRLAVTGFGGLQLTYASALNLTSVEFPGEEIGVRAAEILLEPDDHQDNKVHDLGFRLAIRATT